MNGVPTMDLNPARQRQNQFLIPNSQFLINMYYFTFKYFFFTYPCPPLYSMSA